MGRRSVVLVLVLSQKWVKYLLSQPETGMGYQVVSVRLTNGALFHQVVVDSGYLTRIRGLKGIPFTEKDIAEITVTHDKWSWEEP